MRAWIVVVAVLGCGGKEVAGSQDAEKTDVRVPKVATASVLGSSAAPPFLLLLDDKGKLHVNAVATWDDVSTKPLMTGARSGAPDAIYRFVREANSFAQAPTKALAGLAGSSLEEYEQRPITGEEDPPPPPPEEEEPPPPEEVARPDDGTEETVGAGTAMVLEEGRMGRDEPRAEGQYRMKKDDPERTTRKQRAELARRTGPRGPLGDHPDPRVSGWGTIGKRPESLPTRVATIAGEVVQNGKLEWLDAMIIAAPGTNATKLIELVTKFEAAIAVSHEGKVRPLRLQFVHERGAVRADVAQWLEARVSAKGLAIEAVPDVPIEVATLDPKQVAAAIAKASKARGTQADAPVDVLVDAGVDAQRLVDVLVALDAAGVRMIGLGPAPSADQSTKRGHRIPTVTFGQPSSVGDLDRAEIRRVVTENRAKLVECYAKALATQPELSGTVRVAFLIKPNGTVGDATGTGVDPAAATCIAGAIKGLTFPKPKNNVGVQVSYAFTLRP